MLGKRLLCFLLIFGLVFSGCTSRQTPTTSGSSAPLRPAAPIPLPVDADEAAPYNRSKADDLRRPGALRILCEDVRFARAARPVWLLPDLPQIREYFANYYGVSVDRGVSDTRISEHFRELYAPYARSAKAEMERNPPQISFDRLPAGSYIAFFAPQGEQPGQDATDSPPTNAPLDMFLLRVRLAEAKTTTLTLSERDLPSPGDSGQRARRLLAKDAPLPPDAKEEDAILLQGGERLLWPEGAVLRLPILPPPVPPAQKKEEESEALHPVIHFILVAIGVVIFGFLMYLELQSIWRPDSTVRP
jgi:hypothetical protein